ISLLFELFEPNQHIIADSDLYGGSIRLFDNVSSKNGVEFTRENIAALTASELESLIKPNTKAIYIETPTNPMMNIINIVQTASIAHAHKLLFIVDNTFMSPYFQNPLALGADIVIHSGTKYLSGHNDTLSGFIVTNRRTIAETLRFLIKTTGAGLSPFDSWLTLRGIKTLAIRMEKAQENAQKIAAWLKTQKAVTRVIYPGLREHSGYEIQKRQARGFGSMLTFNVESEEKAKSILKSVRLIQFAESLGGVESLITYPITQTHADVPSEIREQNGITSATLRLSVGIENADDLIADLENALR
ncbi:MAG: PLP-dependent transferase, partial [Spirochaetaceae bacterium]|nr:PLP-dependent transferase [Spirochaetaceae bacterium]